MIGNRKSFFRGLILLSLNDLQTQRHVLESHEFPTGEVEFDRARLLIERSGRHFHFPGLGSFWLDLLKTWHSCTPARSSEDYRALQMNTGYPYKAGSSRLLNVVV